MDSQFELVETGDGSHTIHHKELDETYHSTHGAITESKHVFIEAGLDFLGKVATSINILEIGLGTGLNAALAMEWGHQHPAKQVNYVSLEPFPVSDDLIQRLNYHQLFSIETGKHFNNLHQVSWNEEIKALHNFRLKKIDIPLETFEHSEEPFDLVFFDAFAPKKQPEMWTFENLDKVFKMMVQGGVLVTYCANGQFKRNLKKAGFSVTNIPGPPGKREMTRAFKP